MSHWAKVAARRLMHAKDEKRAVVYVALEPSAEEVEVLLQAGEASVTDIVQGNVADKDVMDASLARVKIPIWTVGRSVISPRHVPRITAARLYDALERMHRDYGTRPYLILLDYIQIFPVERGEERQQQVTEAIIRFKELLQTLGCAGIAGVQASRAVTVREEQIPTDADCQWASALEQTFDKLIGFWRPYLTYRRNPDKPKIKVDGVEHEITQDLLLGRIQKQRFAPAGQTLVLRMEPQYVRIEDRIAASSHPIEEDLDDQLPEDL
jgi:replicative DNA helicase